MDPFMRNLLWGFVIISILGLSLIILMVLSGQDKLAPLATQGAAILESSVAPTSFSPSSRVI